MTIALMHLGMHKDVEQGAQCDVKIIATDLYLLCHTASKVVGLNDAMARLFGPD
jgi:hypothetical protein